VEVNAFEVGSHSCSDDRITLPHPTVCTKSKCSSVVNCSWGMKNMLKDHTIDLTIVDLRFCYSSYMSK
jgi:hypothetical protein